MSTVPNIPSGGTQPDRVETETTVPAPAPQRAEVGDTLGKAEDTSLAPKGVSILEYAGVQSVIIDFFEQMIKNAFGDKGSAALKRIISNAPTDAEIRKAYDQWIADHPGEPVPDYDSFATGIIADYLNEKVTQYLSTLDESSKLSLKDLHRLNKIREKMADAIGAIGMGSIGGIAVMKLGPLHKKNKQAFNSQLQIQNAAQEASADKMFRHDQSVQEMSNYYLQLVGISFTVGTLGAFNDLKPFVSPNASLSGSLISLNSLESFNNLTELDKATEESVIPFIYGLMGQKAALIAQNIDGDKGAFTALYLAGFSESAIDAYLKTGKADPLSVINAQSGLVNFLIDNKVTFGCLNDSTVVNDVFQSAASDLEALGYPLPAGWDKALHAFIGADKSIPMTIQALKDLLTSIIPDEVAVNALILRFAQKETAYQIETQNTFKSNDQLNSAQAQQFTDRLMDAALGTSHDAAIQFLITSDAINLNRFAEELNIQADIQQDMLLSTKIIEGDPKDIPGMPVLTDAINIRNDANPLPPAQITAYTPV